MASTALTDATNPTILDAAAGHVWQVSSGTNLEAVVFTVNAVSPTGVATATAKAATLSAMMSLNAAGLLQLFASPTAGAAGGLVTWASPFFSVSPTGTTTAVVSFSGLNTTSLSSAMLGVSTPSVAASDGFLYIPRVASTPTGTPTVQPGFVALVATSQTVWLNPGATATWYTAGTATSQITTMTSGSGTFFTPPGARLLRVRLVGGGGGGGTGAAAQSGSGGGCGGYVEHWFSPPAPSYAWVLGAGGAQGNPGGTGGNTTFGTLTGSGGTGGQTGATSGAGGAASGGTVNVAGQNGQGGFSATAMAGGQGGSTPFGGGGGGGGQNTVGSAASANSGGGGGGGGSASANNGGAGAAGLIIVEAFF